MDMKEIADLLLPGITTTPADIEARYQDRNLPADALVTRFAPSPTGFVHMGSLYGSLIDMVYAKQSNGVVYLRIEDTDGERTVENGIQGIIDDIWVFDKIFTQDEKQYIYDNKQSIIVHLGNKLSSYELFPDHESYETNDWNIIQSYVKANTITDEFATFAQVSSEVEENYLYDKLLVF